MKVIILCAGYAVRLYPLTLNKPKALFPIRNKVLLDYIIEKIPQEFNEILVVSNDKFYKNFLEWSEQYGDRIKLINDGTARDEDRLGGIGDLFFAIKEEKIDDDILVILGDNLFDFELSTLIDFFKRHKNTMLAVTRFEGLDQLRKLGIVEVKDEKMISFEEKPQEPKSNLASTGLYIFTRNDLKKIEEYMKTDKPKDAPGYLVEDFFKNGQEIYVYTLEGRWYDIGSKEIYEEVKDSW